MSIGDLIPRRWAHFGTVNYEYVRWLRREWFVRPIRQSMSEWLGVDSKSDKSP